MSKVRKILALALIALVISFIAAGCKSKEEHPSPQTPPAQEPNTPPAGEHPEHPK